MNKLKWVTKQDARTNHTSKKRISNLVFPISKAELTIYWFCFGKRFLHNNFNCRCVAVNLNES